MSDNPFMDDPYEPPTAAPTSATTLSPVIWWRRLVRTYFGGRGKDWYFASSTDRLRDRRWWELWSRTN
ncbi:MAG: hypothetical protein NXI04_15885 [Planctomycetaceae bacterium]|nr:hypothetical protein [Planctomycetaceae bacterium]